VGFFYERSTPKVPPGGKKTKGVRGKKQGEKMVGEKLGFCKKTRNQVCGGGNPNG